LLAAKQRCANIDGAAGAVEEAARIADTPARQPSTGSTQPPKQLAGLARVARGRFFGNIGYSGGLCEGSNTILDIIVFWFGSTLSLFAKQ
jgi:hypothetical protein